jgi:hypothetical protein
MARLKIFTFIRSPPRTKGPSISDADLYGAGRPPARQMAYKPMASETVLE